MLIMRLAHLLDELQVTDIMPPLNNNSSSGAFFWASFLPHSRLGLFYSFQVAVAYFHKQQKPIDTNFDSTTILTCNRVFMTQGRSVTD